MAELADSETPHPDRQHPSGDSVSPIGEKDPEELSAEGLFHHAAAARVVTLWMITPVLSLVRSYGVFSLLG